MKPIEEQLWEFIDGTCSADEKKNIGQLLEADPAVKKLYAELLSISQDLNAMELEEPSLRFTQNVMDRIALEPAPKALQTKVDKRIINGIGGFFILTLSALVIFSLTRLNWNIPFMNLNFKMPQFNLPQMDLTKYFGSSFVLGSLIAFVMLGLFTFDRYLQFRKEKHTTTHSS